jgi:hypothetical protein
MPSINDFPARGIIKSASNGQVIFQPANTNYEMHLKVGDDAPPAPSDRPFDAIIRITARKVWTVPTGGNFIEPIFGRPRIIQGRVKWLDDRTLLVHAGTNFVVEMPASAQAVDLANGAIEIGAMVNVTALSGATIQALVAEQAR